MKFRPRLLQSLWLSLFAPRRKTRQDRRHRRYQPTLELLEDRALMSVTVPQWTSIGPAPITYAGNVRPFGTSSSISTGAVEAIAAVPNSNQLYVGTVNGGVWQTQNYTAANPIWTTTTDPLPSLAIMSLAISPTNANVVYAGTGSLSSYGGSILTGGEGGTAVGIYKTTNGGLNWSVIGGNTFGGLRVAQIVTTSLNNGQTLFAATTDTSMNSSKAITKGGIYRSDDGGNSWNRISGTDGLPNTGVTALTFNPNFPDQLYAAVPGALPGVSKNAGIYELDITASSTSVSNITGTLAGSLLNTSVNTLLSISPAGQNPIWAAVFTKGGQIGAVYRGVEGSADNVTWSSPVTGSAGKPPAIYDNSSSGTLHFALAADPNHDNLVYLGGNAMNLSPYSDIVVRGDSTATTNVWTAISDVQGNGGTSSSPYPQAGTIAPKTYGNLTTAPHADSRELIFAGPNLLLACDGGIYECTSPEATEMSAGNLSTWSALNGNIADSEVYNTALDTSNNEVLVANQDTGSDVVNLGPTRQVTLTTGNVTLTQGTTGQIQGGDGSYVQVDNTNHIQYFEADYFYYWTAIPDTGPNAGIAYVPASTVNTATGSATTLTDGFDYQLDNTAAVFTLNAVNPASILVGGGNKGTNGTLYYSTNKGSTFTSIGGLNGTTAPNAITVKAFKGGTYADNSKPTAIAYGTGSAGGTYANAAYIGTKDGDILYSPNVTIPSSGGVYSGDFSETNLYYLTGSSNDEPSNIVMNPNNAQIAYAVVYGVGVYYTTNGSTWAPATGNLASLMTPGASAQDGAESVTLFTPPGQTNPTELLVGGLGGVFQLPLNPATGVPSSSTWTTYGANLPHVLVTSLQYFGGTTDTLLAGTLGRGAWEITNASQTIGLVPQQTVGIYNPAAGQFNLSNVLANPGAGNINFTFSPSSDSTWIPIAGNFSGTGLDTVGLYDPNNAVFHIATASGGTATINFQWTADTVGKDWLPVVGHFFNTSTDTVGLYDPDNMVFHLSMVLGNPTAAQEDSFAVANAGTGWLPIAGDFASSAGSLYTTGLYDPNNAIFHISTTLGGAFTSNFQYGFPAHATPANAWKPIAGDFAGNSTWTVGLYDPNNAIFHVSKVPGNPGSGDIAFPYGGQGWDPVAGDWDFPTLPQLAAGGEARAPSGTVPLNNGPLQTEVQAALNLLAADGVNKSLLAQLGSLQFSVGQLPAGYLGLSDVATGQVEISADAAGYGWFVDPNPLPDQLFVNGAAQPGSAAANRMDLLTVVLHEMGHFDGWTELDPLMHPDALMALTLGTGQRRIQALDAVFAAGL